MKHTPMGYEVVDGKIVINEEEAELVRTMYAVYLLGGSYKAAAKAAGLPLKHSGVKHILQNKKNLGNENYPAIIDKETFDAAEEERLRREVALGRYRNKGKPRPRATYYVGFSVPEVPRKYMDPVQQAEFAYGLVRNEVIR